MEETFVPNREYIDRLIKHSILTKDNKKGVEYIANKKNLLHLELKLTSKEIIQNTKLAFKD
jgi:hypothetical protein